MPQGIEGTSGFEVNEEGSIRVIRVDPRVPTREGSSYQSIQAAVAAADHGDAIVLAPVSHDIGGRMLMVSKSLSFWGETDPRTRTRAEIVGFPVSNDENALIFVRNQEVDIEVAFRNLDVRALRIPDAVHDRGFDCFRLQGGRRGVRTRIDIENVTMSHSGGGIGIEHYIFGDDPSDADFVVSVRNSLITDLFDDRDANGVKQNSSTSQGIYHDGGTLSLYNVTMRRIGWIPGSNIYRKSNKNQGLYAVRGTRRVVACTVENSSHCGFAYRGGTTYSEGNTSRLNPMGFQAGHRQTPGQAVVVSVGDMVADASDMPDTSDGQPTITCGFHIDDAQYVSLSGFSAWNQTGRGGWAALHLSRVQNTYIDVREANLTTWPGGGFKTMEALDLGRHRFERITVKHEQGEPAFIAPDLEPNGLPLGGTWINCKSVEIQAASSMEID